MSKSPYDIFCRACESASINMVSSTVGFCPNCKARHEIVVTNDEQLQEELRVLSQLPADQMETYGRQH